MSQGTKIWKLSLLLLFGLYVLLYIVSSTAVNIYYLKNDPVLGLTYDVSDELQQIYATHIVPGGPAYLAGIKEGDVILKLNGRRLQKMADKEDVYHSITVGDSVDVLVERDGARQVLHFQTKSRLRVYSSTIFLGLLPGVVFCYSLFIIGFFVLLKKIGDTTGHIFFLMVLFWALTMWETFSAGSSIHKFAPQWLRWVSMVYWPIAVGLLLHFTFIFPIERPGLRKRPVFYTLLMYGSALLVIPLLFRDAPSWVELVKYLWTAWFSVCFYLAIRNLFMARKDTAEPHIIKQANLMLAGTAVTLILPLGLYFIPANFFGFRWPYEEAVLLPVVLWPVTLAYAIVKHRFMNINFIVRRGVSYAMISGFVVVAYFVLVVGLGRLIIFLTGSDSQFFTIIATLAIAALFNPAKTRIQNFVELRFFPSRYTYREAIRTFGHQLVNIVDLERLQALVKNFLLKELSIRPVALLWRANAEGNLKLHDQEGLPPGFEFSLPDDNMLVSDLKKRGRLLDLSSYHQSTDPVKQEAVAGWEPLGAEVLMPLLSKGELRGIIALGLKNDGDPFYKEDIELLETLTDQINISLANALLTEELREQERLKNELEVARRIQLSSLPQADPAVEGLDISGVSIPAYEVGGDYYDYLYFPDGRFAVVVGDVSGKGTSAALYMSQLKGILNTASKFHKSLKALVAEVNAIAFGGLEQQSYITLSCALFDVNARRATMVRAGHLPMIQFSASTRLCREIQPRGIGIGLESGNIFERELEECEIDLAPGDIFLFYSDGLTEARNESGVEFTTGELQSCLGSDHVSSACDLREKILARLRAFSNGTAQIDDITLVVVKVR